MAKLVDVYRNNDQKLSRRQLPLQIDENLTMVMDLNSMGFVKWILDLNNPTVKGKELDEFQAKYKVLSPEEVRYAFQVSRKDLMNILSNTIPCVGCRRSVERLFYQLMQSGHPALSPLVVLPEGYLTLQEDHLDWPHLLCTLLHGHSSHLNDLVDSQLRSKKSRRCLLHSLDSQRTRVLSTAWRDVWSVMRPQCRDEVVLIEATTLMATLENYLRKHRFCGECRTKVLRAYALLVEEPEPVQEKGYVPALYAGIKRCLPDKHIHLQTNTEYISDLITRAEPELMGSRRERHAKTLEIAQEEVLTCLGICVYERLHRIQLRLREEECTCQVLAAIAVDALNRNFQKAVECKRGKTQLELLYEEITKEEQLLQQRKEHKKLKKRKRKEKRAGLEEKENCELQVLDRKMKGSPTCSCADCVKNKKSAVKVTNSVTKSKSKCAGQAENLEFPAIVSTEKNKNLNSLSPCESCVNAQELLDAQKGWSSSDHSQDYGYSSENNLGSTGPSGPSSPEGSEVACSDGFCNHDGTGECNSEEGEKIKRLRHSMQTLSLQQMLEESCSSDEESFIPLEEVQKFMAKRPHVTEKRQELRHMLRQRFALMCQMGQLKHQD
ncbi:gametogenetin-binding protein 2-like isoform X2 [Macrosteles quadrilineatus]|uniref:gametogenetin-binding protein 2-like isoform X2 n=1 Tax=Macrosteles quadrilineatus TaxID=74068 RepID=UPI0023E23775|nr:gametogenetin-binding protein 2-like isoform X2 [Macrosteles quadrilineatus]